MMKGSKKLIAFLLAVMMIFSVTGCGKKDSATSAGTTAAPKATQATTAVPSQLPVAAVTKADDYTGFDLGGRTIKVGIWWDYYYTSDHKDINDNPALDNTETAQMKLDNVRRIEEKYNCKIKFVNLSWTGVINSINTSIAAGTPECDVYLTDLQFGIPAALNGLCQNLSDIALEGSDLFGKQSVIKPLDGLGGTYFFQEQGIPISGIFLGYNKTMIQDLGLEDPQQLYKDGKWTWDKFAELAKAGTKDTNGDSTNDVYGYGGVWTNLIDGLVMNNGGSIASGTTEGLSSKPVQEALEFINRLYNVDNSARPWNKDDWNDNLNAWSDGKVLFWTAQAWSLKQQADAVAKDGSEIPFEYSVVPYPNGPSGDGKTYSPYAGNWYMIPVGVKEPGKVLQVMEEFFNWFDGDLEYRDDATWFESCFQTEEDVELAKECGSNTKLDPWGAMSPYFDMGSTVFFPICVTKDKTVAQAVEAAKPTLQNAMDYMYSADKSDEDE